MLCETCERRFSVAENEFAKRLFLPYNEGQVTFEYDHWLLYFAVSLAWRCAATSRREELEKYPQHVQPVDDARQRWGEFLLNDVDALTPYRFNLFFTPAGVQWKTRIPEPLSWYFLRAVDITPVYSRSKVAMYVKFPGMFFWTCVVPPDSGAWRGTRIAKHGTFRAKNQVLSDERAGTFLIERAETVRKRFVTQRLGIDKTGVPSGTVDRVAKRVLDANPLTGLGYVAVDRSLTPAKRPTPRTVTHAADSDREETHAADSDREETHAADSDREETHAADSDREETHAADSDREETHAADSDREETHAADSDREETHAADSDREGHPQGRASAGRVAPRRAGQRLPALHPVDTPRR